MELLFGIPTEKSAPTAQYGLRHGVFRDEGIELALRPLFSGPALADALDKGDLKLALLGTPPATTARSRGARFRIVGGALKQQLHLYLGVRAELNGIGALRGQEIGLLSLGSCDEWIARVILRRNGVDPDREARFVSLGNEYNNVVDMLRDGRIAAAMAIEPNLSLGEAQGVLTVEAAAYESDYLPRFQWTVIAAGERVIAEEPDLIRRFLRAYARASSLAMANIEDYIDMLSATWRLPRDVIARSVARERDHYCLDCAVDVPGVEKALAVQNELGALARPLHTDDVLDLRFLP